MKAAPVGCVPVFVNDQNRALEFYRDKLDYKVIMDVPIMPGIRWLTLAPEQGGAEIILFHPAMAGNGGGGTELKSRVGTWTGIVLLTPDCRAQYREMEGRGVKFDAEPKQPMWGGWMAEFSDPDGNRFQLVERPTHLR